MEMQNNSNNSILKSLGFRFCVALIFFLSVAGFFLWEEHKIHIMDNAALILILGTCIGMHFFMHGSHSHTRGEKDITGSDKRESDQ